MVRPSREGLGPPRPGLPSASVPRPHPGRLRPALTVLFTISRESAGVANLLRPNEWRSGSQAARGLAQGLAHGLPAGGTTLNPFGRPQNVGRRSADSRTARPARGTRRRALRSTSVSHPPTHPHTHRPGGKKKKSEYLSRIQVTRPDQAGPVARPVAFAPTRRPAPGMGSALTGRATPRGCGAGRARLRGFAV